MKSTWEGNAAIGSGFLSKGAKKPLQLLRPFRAPHFARTPARATQSNAVAGKVVRCRKEKRRCRFWLG
jgi:hypothetical protein